MSLGDDSRLGHGVMGFLGNILRHNPLTAPLINAGRAGLLAAREDRPWDDEAANIDLGEAFLGVGPAFGYAPQQTPQVPNRPPRIGGAGAARARDRAAPPGGAARLDPRMLTPEQLQQMLRDLYDPYGHIS